MKIFNIYHVYDKSKKIEKKKKKILTKYMTQVKVQ